jgi:hypothetical protein
VTQYCVEVACFLRVELADAVAQSNRADAGGPSWSLEDVPAGTTLQDGAVTEALEKARHFARTGERVE